MCVCVSGGLEVLSDFFLGDQFLGVLRSQKSGKYGSRIWDRTVGSQAKAKWKIKPNHFSFGGLQALPPQDSTHKAIAEGGCGTEGHCLQNLLKGFQR